MNVQQQHYRTIWPDIQGTYVTIIDQTRLPFAFETVRIETIAAMVNAIKTMQVRGAPLIGVSAAYGIALAMHQNGSDEALDSAVRQLLESRPTAVNLAWAVKRMQQHLALLSPAQRKQAAWDEAANIADEDVLQITDCP